MNVLKLKTRYEDIGSNPPIKNTYDFLSMLLSVGESFNTGFNVLRAREFSEKVEKARNQKLAFVEVSEEFLNMLISDVSKINFLRLGIGGVQISNYVYDLQELVTSRSEPNKEGKK
jgi:hypothetical protein